MFKPLPQDDLKRRKPDLTKARKLLQWEPQVKLAVSLTQTIKCFPRKA